MSTLRKREAAEDRVRRERMKCNDYLLLELEYYTDEELHKILAMEGCCYSGSHGFWLLQMTFLEKSA